MASLELPFGIKVLNPTPVDAKYLNDGVPYASVSEVNSVIGAGIRHTGLTVNIGGVEYWYATGIGDGDLVVKSSGGSGSGERIEKEYTQVTHGFSIGDVIAWSGGTFIKAIADGSQSAEVVGFVTQVADINNFTVVFSGYIEGISGLTLNSNTTYFLSTTVLGGLTSTQPSGENEISKPILTTFTTNDALVFQYREFVISSGTSTGGVTGITAIANIGTGAGEIYSSLINSGQTAQLRTITGSGNTVVSTSGDTVIVYSSGGTGTGKQVFVTTGTTVAIPNTSINALYVASGTTGYTLTASPTIGAEITFVDELGTAGTTNITIFGNGNIIYDDTYALINTNNGSITLQYNGYKWNVTAFIN